MSTIHPESDKPNSKRLPKAVEFYNLPKRGGGGAAEAKIEKQEIGL